MGPMPLHALKRVANVRSRHWAACLLVGLSTASLGGLAPSGQASSSRATAPNYTVTQLGAADLTSVTAFDVNVRGDVVGEFQDSEGAHGFLIDAGGFHDLGSTLPRFLPHAINDRGEMAGALRLMINDEFVTHAATRTLSGPVRDLGTLGGRDSDAQDINYAGQVVGNSTTATGFGRAFLWSGTAMSEIGPADGNPVAVAINDRGQVAITDDRGDFGFSHAFRYESGVTTELDRPAGAQGAFASGINAEGVVSGWVDRYYGTLITGSPFRWTGTAPEELGPLGRTADINCQGDIVGTYGTELGAPRIPVLFRNSEVIDLSSELPPAQSTNPAAINDRGQIVVNQFDGGVQRAYLLTPIAPLVACSPSSPTELELALSFRPYLLFDDTEPWRPISLDALLAEQVNGQPAHSVCHTRAIISDRCAAAATTDDLLAFEAGDPGGNYLDIRGNQRRTFPGPRPVDADYSAPSSAGCTIFTGRDCDSGPNSLIYYNRTVGEGLDGSAGARSYWDYWSFFRYNHSNFSTCLPGLPRTVSLCYEHEGDWEGVTVVTSVEPEAPSVYWVAYAAHEGWYRYSADALQQAGRFDGLHAKAYVASGSHAAYPRPCERVNGFCTQQALLPSGIAPRPDGAYDGEIPWSRNFDQLCAATDPCVRPLPEIDATPTTQPPNNADNWNAWPGRWGRRCNDAFCQRADSPGSPGRQNRYNGPWYADTNPRIPAGVNRNSRSAILSRIRKESRCGSWFGVGVAALACDERALRRTLTSNAFERRGSVSLRLMQPGAGAASYPGLAQALGRPLLGGERLNVKAGPNAGGALWLRVMVGKTPAIASFEIRGLGRGGAFAVVTGRDTRASSVALRRLDGVMVEAQSVHLALRPPERVRVVQRGRTTFVSLVATGERTHVWVVSPRGERLIAHRTLVTASGQLAKVAFKELPRDTVVVTATRSQRSGYSWARVARPNTRGN